MPSLAPIARRFFAFRHRILTFLFYALGIAAAAAATGAAIGFWERQAQILLFAEEADKLLQIDDADTLQALLPGLQERWSYLTQNAPTRLQMAAVYLHAAERLPRPRPYLEAAQEEAAHALALSDEDDALLRLQANALAANAALPLGREREAYQALEACEALLFALPPAHRLRWRAMHQNNLAYLYATATEPTLRDPPRALALAEALLRRPPQDGEVPTSENAAFLDTLAEAYYARGNFRQALIVQRLALARAAGEDLAIYLKHYDKYRAAAGGQTAAGSVLRQAQLLF